ncbi:MAG: hypothetical protein ACOYBE_11200 [Blautia sp.]
MRERLSLFFSSLCVVLLLPCVLTFFITGVSACAIDRELDLEKCLPAALSSQLPKDCGTECKKALAVLVRTNMHRQMADGKSLPKILWEYIKTQGKPSLFFGEKNYASCQGAARKTKGMLLVYQGEPVYTPYHAMSAGKTREGAEAFGDDRFSYLLPVDSSEDRKAETYGTPVYIPLEQLPDQLEIKRRDASGYVTELLADGQAISGELFRQQMGLPSACFSMEKRGSTMRFYCKGQGHGVGLSQYGAACLEDAGMGYQEILNYYFPALAIENSSDGIA